MIQYPERFNQSMPAGYDGLFAWDFLKPAFAGTKIEPMDIDGIVERHGHFLLFETKSPDKEIPKGQRITLTRLIDLGRGKIHLIVVYGKTDIEISAMEEWYYSRGRCRIKAKMACDAAYVLQRVTAWFQHVNRKEDIW